MALSSVTEDKLFEGPLSSCNEDVLLVVVVRTETISFYASKSSARKSEQASGRHKPRASGPLSLGPFDEPCQFSRLLGVFRTTSRQHVRQQRGCHRTEAVRRARRISASTSPIARHIVRGSLDDSPLSRRVLIRRHESRCERCRKRKVRFRAEAK